MCDIPIPVASEENIVRAVFSQHLDGNSLKKNFFRDEGTSVMRHTYMGTDQCRAKAKQIVPGNANVRYKGLAITRVSAFRENGSDIIDSRGIYCGHAHVTHMQQLQQAEPGEPVEDPNQLMNLDERLRALKKATRVCLEADPSDPNWTGPQVEPLPQQ
jgi:hypothetical protein